MISSQLRSVNVVIEKHLMSFYSVGITFSGEPIYEFHLTYDRMHSIIDSIYRAVHRIIRL